MYALQLLDFWIIRKKNLLDPCSAQADIEQNETTASGTTKMRNSEKKATFYGKQFMKKRSPIFSSLANVRMNIISYLIRIEYYSFTNFSYYYNHVNY